MKSRLWQSPAIFILNWQLWHNWLQARDEEEGSSRVVEEEEEEQQEKAQTKML